MKTITKSYNVYLFDELEQKAKEKAIEGEIQLWLEIFYGNEDNTPPEIVKAFKQADAMQTPWFTGSYIWEYAKDIILDGCKQYDYLSDGAIFSE
jgi:hypothetical protein